jgi:hypothetical protein
VDVDGDEEPHPAAATITSASTAKRSHHANDVTPEAPAEGRADAVRHGRPEWNISPG